MRLNPAVVGAIIACQAHADLGDQLFELLADDGAQLDRFGASVGMSRTIAIVGTSQHDDNGTDSGSAYLFDVGRSCPADIDAEDFFGYLDLFVKGC